MFIFPFCQRHGNVPIAAMVRSAEQMRLDRRAAAELREQRAEEKLQEQNKLRLEEMQKRQLEVSMSIMIIYLSVRRSI